MLINTKHIVMFDDAANDFPRIANMVDDDGAVLILRDGKPAYAVVSFDDVQEDERPRPSAKAEEPKCGCGKPQSKCDCRGHGGHQHGNHAHGPHHGGGHGPHPHGPHHGQYFGHGGDAGHLHHEGPGFCFPEDAYSEGEPYPGSEEASGEWDFSFHTGSGFDPLFKGGPEISIDEVISKVPPEVLDAGRRFVNQLSPLFSLFGGAAGSSAFPTDPPKSE